MPNIKSAKKALRQNKRRRIRNLAQQQTLKGIIREVKRAAANKQIGEFNKLLPLLYKKLDKAAKNNLIHKNRAGRLKSRLVKLIK